MAGTTRRRARAGRRARKAPRAPTVEKHLLRLLVTGTVGTFTDRQRVLRALQLGTVEPPVPARGGDR